MVERPRRLQDHTQLNHCVWRRMTIAPGTVMEPQSKDQPKIRRLALGSFRSFARNAPWKFQLYHAQAKTDLSAPFGGWTMSFLYVAVFCPPPPPRGRRLPIIVTQQLTQTRRHSHSIQRLSPEADQIENFSSCWAAQLGASL